MEHIVVGFLFILALVVLPAILGYMFAELEDSFLDCWLRGIFIFFMVACFLILCYLVGYALNKII